MESCRVSRDDDIKPEWKIAGRTIAEFSKAEVDEISEDLLRQQSCASKNQLGHPTGQKIAGVTSVLDLCDIMKLNSTGSTKTDEMRVEKTGLFPVFTVFVIQGR